MFADSPQRSETSNDRESGSSDEASPAREMPELPDPGHLGFSPLTPGGISNRVPSGKIRNGYVASNWNLSLTEVKRQKIESYERVIKVAGGSRDTGLNQLDRLAGIHFFADCVFAVADSANDPAAMRRLSDALQAPDNLRILHANGIKIESTFHPNRLVDDIDSSLQKLDIHYIAVGMGADQLPGHAMGIAIQKIDDDEFTLAVLDSNGFSGRPRNPVISAKIDKQQLVDALSELGNIPLISPPYHDIGRQYADIMEGWLQEASGSGDTLSNGFAANSTVSQTPQKSGDCGIENTFVLMSAVLSRSDYKLAKAACLNALHLVGRDLIRRDPSQTIVQAEMNRLVGRLENASDAWTRS